MKLSCFLPVVFCTLITTSLPAAEAPVRLWPAPAPGALGTDEKDIPNLTPYPAAGTNISGAAMVILPGGGYGMLAPHEGQGYAEWLVTNGIACFVVKYRLGSDGYRHPRMLEDAARAVRLVRSRASEWKIDPKRVGIIGSSAGGHLASTLMTRFDAGNPDSSDPVEKESSRPDLGILCYPVITMGTNTHKGSKKNLLGETPAAELVESLSNESQVRKDTPPCFVWHTWEDTAVKVENSLQFVLALQKAGVRYDFHVYEKGAHGIGLGNHHPWAGDCISWLHEHKFVK